MPFVWLPPSLRLPLPSLLRLLPLGKAYFPAHTHILIKYLFATPNSKAREFEKVCALHKIQAQIKGASFIMKCETIISKLLLSDGSKDLSSLLCERGEIKDN